jgi:S-adenosylmethionine decarboxylase
MQTPELQLPERTPPLCPEIHRQRLIVEGLYGLQQITEDCVRRILAELTHNMCMTPLADPLIFSPDAVSELHHGIGGFQAWAESGCSLYTWAPQRLFTLDVYSCKPFDEIELVSFASAALRGLEVRWRSA